MEYKSKNGKPYTEEQITSIMATEITKKGLSETQANLLLREQFGLNEEIHERIIDMAFRLVEGTVVIPTFRGVADTITINDIFSETNLNATEAMFKSKIAQCDLDYLNEKLKAIKLRPLTFKDFAAMFVAFKKNVMGNENGGCPLNSIIGFTKDHLEYPLNTLHVSKAIDIFCLLKLAIKIRKHNHFKRQGSCYKMLPE